MRKIYYEHGDIYLEIPSYNPMIQSFTIKIGN